MKFYQKVSLLVSLLLLISCTPNLAGCKKYCIKNVGDDAGVWSLPILYNAGSNEISKKVKLDELLKDPEVKLVLLHIWATWCKPCEQEMPYLEEMYQTYHDKGLMVLGITIDRSKDLQWTIINTVKDLKKRDGSPANISYPILWDIDVSLKQLYDISSVPRHILIDKNNKVVFLSSSFSVEIVKELSDKVGELLK